MAIIDGLVAGFWILVLIGVAALYHEFWRIYTRGAVRDKKAIWPFYFRAVAGALLFATVAYVLLGEEIGDDRDPLQGAAIYVEPREATDADRAKNGARMGLIVLVLGCYGVWREHKKARERAAYFD